MCFNNVSTQTLNTLSTINTVAGTLAQMKAARDQASYQASIANQNAKIADQQAIAAGQAGAMEQSKIRQRARQIEGAQKAAIAANGLDTGTGSPLAILGDTAYLSEQDVQNSRYNTALQMWGLNEQAKDYRNQAENIKRAGKNEANVTLLTGLTSLAKQYNAFNSGSGKNKTTAKQTISPNYKYVKNTGLPNYKFNGW